VIFDRATTVYLATGHVDLRWGFDALTGMVKDRMYEDPRSGALFVFLNARRTRLKVLFYDGTGYWLLHKRLDKGTFPMPVVMVPNQEQMTISRDELELMLRGLEDPRRVLPRRRRTKKTTPLVH
jgi:transposase